MHHPPYFQQPFEKDRGGQVGQFGSKNPPNGDRMEHYPLVVVKELLLQLLSHPRRRQLGHLEVVVRGSVGLRPNVPISFNGLYHSQTLFRLNQALRSLQL